MIMISITQAIRQLKPDHTEKMGKAVLKNFQTQKNIGYYFDSNLKNFPY